MAEEQEKKESYVFDDAVLNNLLIKHIKDAKKKGQTEKEKVLTGLHTEYRRWVTANGPEQATVNYNRFNRFYDENIEEIRKVLHERERTALSGHKLETFCYHLLKGMAESFGLDVRQARILSWMGFAPQTISDFAEDKIQIKTLKMSGDLVIGKDVNININNTDRKELIPLVLISCKAYIDFTILRGLVQEAEEILNANPKALFFAVAETDHLGMDNKAVIERWAHKIRGFYIFMQNQEGKEIEELNVEIVRKFYEDVYNHLKRYAKS